MYSVWDFGLVFGLVLRLFDILVPRFFLRTIVNYVQAITKMIQTIPGNACGRQPGPTCIYRYRYVFPHDRVQSIRRNEWVQQEKKREKKRRGRGREEADG